ncbi:hypothetical protein [Streptomyces sp. B21-101]|uniref:hypothetical protein n=1 Tax=Streptomyces sp. B21-101 TaxID=3039415 RepID=UPI002FF39579
MPNTPDPQAAKAEALLLRFAAEAHRRKWAYDRGLDDDGVPIKSEAFDALHRLGEEMRTALEELRRTPAVVPSAAGTTNRAALYREAAEQLLASDLGPRPGHTEDYGNGWSDATLRAQSYLLGLAQTADVSRVAAEEQPAETQWPGERCGLCPPGTRTRHVEDHMVQVHGARPTARPAETQDGIDLADRLEAALTERFTELGNPFSEMRRHEQGPDGWPASHPVGPNTVAEVLRELMADETPAARPAVAEQPDTQTREA